MLGHYFPEFSVEITFLQVPLKAVLEPLLLTTLISVSFVFTSSQWNVTQYSIADSERQGNGAIDPWFQVGWLLEFYVLATSKVISGQVPICDSAQPSRLYSAVPVRKSGCQHHGLISHTVTLSRH